MLRNVGFMSFPFLSMNKYFFIFPAPKQTYCVAATRSMRRTYEEKYKNTSILRALAFYDLIVYYTMSCLFRWKQARFKLSVNFRLFYIFCKNHFSFAKCCFIIDMMSISCGPLGCASKARSYGKSFWLVLV
jgi:hypothetical protein